MGITHIVMFKFLTGATGTSDGGEVLFGPHMVSIPSYGQSIITGRFS